MQCIENPATGGLVGDHCIEEFMPYSIAVDYCPYGGDINKSTRLWWTVDPKLCNFKALRCQGQGKCMAMIFGEHGREWRDMPLVDRYWVPGCLGIQVANAMLSYFAANPMVLHDDYDETCFATMHKTAEHV